LERWLLDSALPLWWNVGADNCGGFHETIGLDGLPPVGTRRARVQGRQSYVYAYAGAVGWRGPWQSATKHGLNYLNDRYRMHDGLYATLVSHDGIVLDATVKTYDQAFVLLALAWQYRMWPHSSQIETAAQNIRKRLECIKRHANGGFVEASDIPFQSNPHMHLLEAALAWSDIAAAGSNWNSLADEIVTLALSRFLDLEGGFLREYFDENWEQLPGAAGRIVEPGHQFEWAWLLERWARKRGDDPAKRFARRLFEAGTRGVDRARHVAVDEVDNNFNVTRNSARLWPQTERLKAALILSQAAEGEARARYLGEACEAVCALWRYLDAPISGLWRDKLLPNDQFVEEPAPASSFYHIVCAIAVLKDVTSE
jgi:mannose-6-phosphate isomerase